MRALTFDVFGTVVDWRGSIVRELQALGRAKAIEADWAGFADAWRAGYRPAMDRVRKGELPWINLDDLHRMILDELIPRHGLEALSAAEREHLNRAWHRLSPWPDAIEGLQRLRTRYLIGTLSNGNVSLLTNLARHADLPWDFILSAEMARHYKPDAEVYQTAVQSLGLAAGEVMMVAAHRDDLEAAKKAGMKTAFVPRPQEHGPEGRAEVAPEADLVATDFLDLAEKLGA